MDRHLSRSGSGATSVSLDASRIRRTRTHVTSDLNYAARQVRGGRMSFALPSHVDEADLISYGLLGLIAPSSASISADQVRTYAVAHQGSIIDELRSMDWVPGPSVRGRARSTHLGGLEHKLHRRRRTGRPSGSRSTSSRTASPDRQFVARGPRRCGAARAATDHRAHRRSVTVHRAIRRRHGRDRTRITWRTPSPGLPERGKSSSLYYTGLTLQIGRSRRHRVA